MKNLRKRIERLEKIFRPAKTLVELKKLIEDSPQSLKISDNDLLKIFEFSELLDRKVQALLKERRQQGIPDPPPGTEEDREKAFQAFLEKCKRSSRKRSRFRKSQGTPRETSNLKSNE